ncbi:sigma-70 family RNA polymerase sigma factor [Gluconobacter sp. R71646]|uniref:Sigma-70 family RNA polymerase sigma factor n=1 Tax=Gluconobacter potus TaxID=2724927 RepID=A0ABR9YQA2_9PROT|nr:MULTISPECIES: sigma-70 family RNA polymerase sigma factor [Gluconobacter]MBF0852227.1 sigma-70 family RNA polymerase sigma factor [Gluconobacter sp. R75690]MBF0865890.1 sigma-70 family RNA polymerase sigma factor [Gluconobacter sp. R71656]MBF0869001.1 sigma-70 family RNA polymerase sigma factor [Gluconobacter sp. R75628]MBF0874954.1 sigma-70 family RNA polymerase sigma factor [Gluconobacter sp. R75629]MBF0880947.1 sigma-70 family RNA polymerase sigma factor [Gluconobacter sp. R75828]
MLKTQIKSSPKNRQSNRQKPEITSQAHQPTVLRSLQVRGQSDLRPWLFTIAHRLIVNHWRRLRRFVSWTETMQPEPLQEADQIPHLQWQEVVQAFGHLSDDHRQIMMLVSVEGLQYGVVAEILDLPIGTVMSRLSRARAALHSLVEHEERPTLRRVK